jgi:hypothetical protein
MSLTGNETKAERWRYQQEITTSPFDGAAPTMTYEVYSDSGPFRHPATAYIEADAEFIVRACNNHADLLAVLKDLVYRTRGLEWLNVDDACEVIDKAEGQS